MWSLDADLDRGPAVYKTAALPLSYPGRLFACKNVSGRGLEPPIPYGNYLLKVARLPISPPRLNPLKLIIITKKVH